jgi:hypothetical protein
MNVDIKMEGIEKALQSLDPQIVRKAAVSAINKTADQAKTQVSQLIREGYNIRAGDLNRYLQIVARATTGALTAIIAGKGRGLALAYFGARQRNVKIMTAGKGKNKVKMKVFGRYGQAAGDVTVQVKTSSGRLTVSTDPKAFMTVLKSGHVGILMREGKARLPIKELLGPGVGHIFGGKALMTKVGNFINAKFQDIFTHELDFFSKK